MTKEQVLIGLTLLTAAFFFILLKEDKIVYKSQSESEKAIQERLILLKKERDSLSILTDSIIKELAKTDTIIKQTKGVINEKTKDIISLNSDGTIRLFNEWTRFVYDSLNRKGHFRTMPDSLGNGS